MPNICIAQIASQFTNTVSNSVKTGETVGYSRLKGIFNNGINYKNYDTFVSTAKNKVVGNLPKDILADTIRLPNKVEIIKTIQQGFSSIVSKKNVFAVLNASLISSFVSFLALFKIFSWS
jgi:hypothetical protein